MTALRNGHHRRNALVLILMLVLILSAFSATPASAAHPYDKNLRACVKNGKQTVGKPRKSGTTIRAGSSITCPKKVPKITLWTRLQQRRFGYWSTKASKTINVKNRKYLLTTAIWKNCKGSGSQLYRAQSGLTLYNGAGDYVGHWVKQSKNVRLSC